MIKLKGSKGELIAICDRLSCSEKEKTEWYGDENQGLQVSKVCSFQKAFASHKHKHRIREIERTQEAIISINGGVEIKIFDNNKDYLGTFKLDEGDICILYNGYHELIVSGSKAIFYEIKTGPFNCTVKEDKEYFDDTSI